MRFAWRILIMTICAMGLIACSSPRGRVADGLRELGVAKRPAKCVAREMDDRLSKRQMKSVVRLLEAMDDAESRPGRVVDRLSRADDPEIATAAAQSGISCTLLR